MNIYHILFALKLVAHIILYNHLSFMNWRNENLSFTSTIRYMNAASYGQDKKNAGKCKGDKYFSVISNLLKLPCLDSIKAPSLSVNDIMRNKSIKNFVSTEKFHTKSCLRSTAIAC
jgi:hypothetical protein